MQVRFDLTKSDLAQSSLVLIVKSPATWIKGVVFNAFLVGILIYFFRNPQSRFDWAMLVLSSFVGGLMGFIFSVGVNMANLLLVVTKKAGLLGEHLIEIGDDGLREKTKQNDTFQSWQGMLAPIRSNRLILIRVNAYLLHVVPRRAFKDDIQYESFWRELNQRCGAAP